MVSAVSSSFPEPGNYSVRFVTVAEPCELGANTTHFGRATQRRRDRRVSHKLLIQVLEVGVLVQSIVGATDRRRSIKRPWSSAKTPGLIGFPGSGFPAVVLRIRRSSRFGGETGVTPIRRIDIPLHFPERIVESTTSMSEPGCGRTGRPKGEPQERLGTAFQRRASLYCSYGYHIVFSIYS